jgi:hypothetical protein
MDTDTSSRGFQMSRFTLLSSHFSVRVQDSVRSVRLQPDLDEREHEPSSENWEA